jgi:hypothetical protein
MSEIVEQVRVMTETGWKVLCAAFILSLGLLVLDRRAKERTVQKVRRAEKPRQRRAA